MSSIREPKSEWITGGNLGLRKDDSHTALSTPPHPNPPNPPARILIPRQRSIEKASVPASIPWRANDRLTTCSCIWSDVRECSAMLSQLVGMASRPSVNDHFDSANSKKNSLGADCWQSLSYWSPSIVLARAMTLYVYWDREYLLRWSRSTTSRRHFNIVVCWYLRRLDQWLYVIKAPIYCTILWSDI